MSAGTFDPAFNPPSPPLEASSPEPAPAPAPPALAPAPTPEAPPLTRAFQALGLLATEGASLGFAGWCLRARDHLLAYVAGNSMPPAARKYVFGNLLAGAAAAGLGGLVAILWRRLGGIALVERVARRLAPLCLVGLLPIFFHWQLWYGGRELTFIVMVSAFVLSLQVLTRVSLDTPPILPASLRARVGARLGPPLARVRDVKWLPFAIVFTAFLAYTIYFSIITIQNHFRLQTMGWDLGIENNLVWNAAHFNKPLFKTSVLGNETTTHIGFHETYISYLIGIFYRLAPRPETLLVLQSALIGGAVLPFFAFARRHLGAWTACLLAVLINLYAPLHGSNLYDFHYLPFAPIFLWWCLWALESRRNGMAVLAVILTLANREDMSALLMVVGLYLILTGERPRAGLIVTLISAAYFIGIKLILMPHFLNGYPAYINQYEGLLPEGETGFGGILKTVIGNPAFTVTSLLEHDKVLYLLEIVAPLAFFPWRRPIGLLCSIPGFFFTLLATHYPPLLSISFQYTAYWTSFYFIAVVANLAWLRRVEEAGAGWARRSRRAWLVAITAGTIVTSYQLGIVLQHNTAWGGFAPFRIGVTDAERARHADLYSLIKLIPQEATVSASENIVSQISSRKNAYSLRLAYNNADYILVHFPSGGEDRGTLINALKSGLYGLQAQKGEFALFRKGLKADTAAPFLRQLGA
jgi:uncharacterized membrane protein